jgi:hypothetical protein
MRRRLVKLLPHLLAAAIVSLVYSQAAAQWILEPVDMAGNSGWSLSLDVDSTGAAHAAYFTTNPNGDFRTARQTPTGWQAGPNLNNASAYALDANDNQFFFNVGSSPNF